MPEIALRLALQDMSVPGAWAPGLEAQTCFRNVPGYSFSMGVMEFGFKGALRGGF
jgi:hypothetical protein